MTVTQTPGAVKKFRRTPWRFQQTVERPEASDLERFVFYSDHDDWITFYANTKSNINHVIEPLASQGCKLVQNWQRDL